MNLKELLKKWEADGDSFEEVGDLRAVVLYECANELETWMRDNMKTQIPEIVRNKDKMTLYEHQLFQICNGPVWDGDLISKSARDELFMDGYVQKVANGWNIITENGFRHWLSLAKLSASEMKWTPNADRDIIP